MDELRGNAKGECLGIAIRSRLAVDIPSVRQACTIEAVLKTKGVLQNLSIAWVIIGEYDIEHLSEV